MNSLDVIIPVSSLVAASVDERLKTLEFAMERFYDKQSGIQLHVIIVEQDTRDGFKYLFHRAHPWLHVKIKYHTFNKGWCLNVGARHSKADFLLFADCDMWCPDDYLAKAVRWMKMEKLNWGFAWNELYYTTEKEKPKVFSDGNVGGECQRFLTTPRRGYSEGGLVLVRREAWEAIGGANEWFEELGGIDTEIIDRLHGKYGTYAAFPQKVYHLWHQQSKKSLRPSRRRNIEYIHFCRKNKNAVEWLTRQRWGDISGPLVQHGEFKVLANKGDDLK